VLVCKTTSTRQKEPILVRTECALSRTVRWPYPTFCDRVATCVASVSKLSSLPLSTNMDCRNGSPTNLCNQDHPKRFRTCRRRRVLRCNSMRRMDWVPMHRECHQTVLGQSRENRPEDRMSLQIQ